MPTQPAAQPARTRPIHEITLGPVRAAIWANETENGVRYNVTFERSYRDGDTWKSTGSFGVNDLLVLGKAADQAHTWILSQPRERPDQSEGSASRSRKKGSGSLSDARIAPPAS